MGIRLITGYYLVFLCVNVFFPKINLGGVSFYLFELSNALLFLFFFLLYGKMFFGTSVLKTYAAFMLLTLLSFWVGFQKFGFFDAPSFGRLLKFTFFTFYIVFPYYLYRYVTVRHIKYVLNFQFLFFIAAGCYVLYNMVTTPASINEYIWGYDNRYRLIGLTGYGIGLDGQIERLFGTTSVSMGVFVAFVFLVYLAMYLHSKSMVLWLKLVLLLFLELLTYSRTGIIVLVTGILYFILLNARPLFLLRVAAVFFLLFIAGYWSGAFESLAKLGTVAKLVELSPLKDPRVIMFIEGVQYLVKNPLAFLVGSGYGEMYTEEAVGYSHLEGLFPTTLVTSGLFAVIVLALHFYYLWLYAKRGSQQTLSQYHVFLYGVRLFVPGWFLSSVLSGNTFQTDFYFPIVYFIFMVSYFHTRDEAESRSTG